MRFILFAIVEGLDVVRYCARARVALPQVVYPHGEMVFFDVELAPRLKVLSLARPAQYNLAGRTFEAPAEPELFSKLEE